MTKHSENTEPSNGTKPVLANRCGILNKNVIMKIISRKPKGQRFFKSVTIHSKYSDGSKKRMKRPFWVEPVINKGESFLWFNTETGEWGEKGNTSIYYAMSYDGFNNAYSLKAVKRLISKWNVPKGTKFIASLPFLGYDFFLTKS